VAGDLAGASWQRIAASVVSRSLGLRRDQSVLIETWSHALPAAEVVAREARRLGIRPTILYASEGSFLNGAGRSRPEDIGALSRAEVAAAKSCDGYVFLPAGPDDLARLETLPLPLRQAYNRRRRDWWELLVRYSVPSVYLLAASATPSAARRFGVNISRWTREAVRASVVPREKIQSGARSVASRFRRGRSIRISHPNGTELELALLRRQPVIDDGVVDRQDLSIGRVGTVVPGGYVSVALDEAVADGEFVSNRPTRTRSETYRGIRWTFEQGRLKSCTVESGSGFLGSAYRAAGPERDRPAILVVGLNPELHDFPFAEDQERGVVTLYIGHNDDFGGQSQGSFRRFALLRGATLSVDRRPVISSGRID